MVEHKMTTIAIISSEAKSLINFRGPLIQALISKDFRVLALAPNYDDRLREKIRSLGADPIDCNISRTSINPFRDMADVLNLIRLLHRLKPDIVFGYVVKPVIYGTLAAWIARVPRRVSLITGLGLIFTDSGRKKSAKERLLKRVVQLMYRISLKRSGQVIFQNKDDMKDFINWGLVDAEKATCICGTGIDLNEWPFTPPVIAPVTFLLAARFLPEKGIRDYVEASRCVKSQYSQVRCLLLGDLDSNPSSITKSEVNAWVDAGIIEWPGYVPVKPWIKKSSVYVLPSYYREGVPRSTQEAMAMGRPVITTDSPGCKETVIEGQNGFIVPVRDPSALEQAMVKFIENPDLVQSMGKNSRRLAVERFDVNKINAQIIKIIDFPKEDQNPHN